MRVHVDVPTQEAMMQGSLGRQVELETHVGPAHVPVVQGSGGMQVSPSRSTLPQDTLPRVARVQTLVVHELRSLVAQIIGAPITHAPLSQVAGVHGSITEHMLSMLFGL